MRMMLMLSGCARWPLCQVGHRVKLLQLAEQQCGLAGPGRLQFTIRTKPDIKYQGVVLQNKMRNGMECKGSSH